MSEAKGHKNRDAQGPYVHALRFRWLTPLYDSLVAATTREKVFKQALVEQAALRPGQRVLDLGCGTGTLAIAIARSLPNVEVEGLDGDADILQRAQAKAAAAGLVIRWTEARATAQPYGDERFDRVLSTLFFHHLTPADKLSAAREVYRVLKPGGELHVADWGPPTSLWQRTLFFAVQLLDGFENTSLHVEGGLAAIFEQAGFAEVQQVRRLPTVFGTMVLYQMRKADS